LQSHNCWGEHPSLCSSKFQLIVASSQFLRVKNTRLIECSISLSEILKFQKLQLVLGPNVCRLNHVIIWYSQLRLVNIDLGRVSKTGNVLIIVTTNNDISKCIITSLVSIEQCHAFPAHGIWKGRTWATA